MNTQIQNVALNEQPPNQNRQSDMHKYDKEQQVQNEVASKQHAPKDTVARKPSPPEKK